MSLAGQPGSAGFQAVRWNRAGSEQEKEAVAPGDYWAEIGDKEVVLSTLDEESSDAGSDEKAKRGKRRKWLWILVPVILIILVSIAGTVIGVLFACRMTDTKILTGPPMKTFKSTFGVYNGTGMTVTDARNGVDDIWLFYRDQKGDIRKLAHTKGGVWQRSQNLSLKNAANSTVLAATTYDVLGSTKTHLAYSDTDGILRDIVWTNPSSTFTTGSLEDQYYKVSTDPKVKRELSWKVDQNKRAILSASGKDGKTHQYTLDLTADTWEESTKSSPKELRLREPLPRGNDQH